MGNVIQDFRYALRMLRKSAGFTVVAILTLAIGIGASTAIFSLLDQVLLRRLPVQKPEQLVVLRSPGNVSGSRWGDGGPEGQTFSYPMFKALREKNEALSGLLARYVTRVSVSYQGDTELAECELISGNYFEVLGVRPALGRVFSMNDEQAPGANPVVVLSYGYWQRHFGGNPQVLNQSVPINGTPMTIVGVAQAGIQGRAGRPVAGSFHSADDGGAGDAQRVVARQVGQLLAAADREAEAGHVDAASAGFAAGDVSRARGGASGADHQVGIRSAAATVHRSQDVIDARLAGAAHIAERRAGAAAGARRHGDFGAADRVHERGEPADGAGSVAQPRICDPAGAGRGSHAIGARGVDRELDCWRWREGWRGCSLRCGASTR